VVATLFTNKVATAFLTTEPWLTLTVVGIVYTSSIPLTVRSYYRLKRAAQARAADAVEKPQPVPLPTPASLPIGAANAPSSEWRH